MRKISHISISLLLSFLILTIGSGVNVMRCSRTGAVKIMTMFSVDEMHKVLCTSHTCCITMEHVELSPTDVSPTISHDFHATQAPLTILPTCYAEWFMPVIKDLTINRSFCHVWRGHPRSYLHFIRVLQI